MKIITLRAVLAAALGATFGLATLIGAGPAHAQGVSASTILIGQSAPLSGSNKELGEDIRNRCTNPFCGTGDERDPLRYLDRSHRRL